ncbi:hypothetical protein [Microbacterium aurum]|uniref:hypothetical protein n=1 Tax=Microbacterium aurum TaxID=36805 RepID=UPI0028E4774B|nr:hypothetical protein [Microbacterium aurum]
MAIEQPAPLRTNSTRSRPERPALESANHAPVLAHVPPPFSVRCAQLFWILAIAVGAVCIVYAFVVRAEQVELLTEKVRAIDPDRPDATLTSAADIIYWTVFGVLVAVVLLQILVLVSFTGRRPRARWWMLATLLLLTIALAFGVGVELAAEGTDGAPLRPLLLAQLGLGALALLLSTWPAALRWTARGFDVRRGPSGGAVGGGDL